MLAVVLAGGKGRRLMPYTAEIPKPLVKLDERSVLEHLLEQMRKTGVDEVCLSVNHHAEKIKEVIKDGSSFGIRVRYTEEKEPLSTAAPLLLIDNLPENFIVVNGDILTDLSFDEVYEIHVKNKALCTIVTQQRRGQMEYGVIETDEAGRIRSFTEKPAYEFVVSCGVYVFNREILEHIPENQAYGFDQLMLSLLEKKVSINTYSFDGYWLDIGRIEDYEQARLDLARLKNQR